MGEIQDINLYCPNCMQCTDHKIRLITRELADKHDIPSSFIGQYVCKCLQCTHIHTGKFPGQ